MDPDCSTFFCQAWTARWSLLEGLMVTISSSIMTIVIGTVLGFVVGLILTYGMLPLRLLARLYVDVMRGIPVLVLILFTYYGLAILKIGVKPYWAGVIALSLFCVSHVAENVRGAVQSIPQGQHEAGMAIGMRFFQRLRWIILPQAVRRALPPWVNTALEIVKGTTLLSVIGVVELLLASQQAIARNYMILQFYMAATIVYIIINFSIAQAAAALERRYAYLRY
ncbi:MAG: amino acid ABC transporter permease [Geminicoccaceae bacterium]|jgi:polar amino acid transport system permease protein|nr:amino acid ABC transporter permease [Geminicoccaceae bacterium]MCB9969118.1 amino acid ABC transporter permease [Geminicoccaceae bacterium]